MAFCGYDRFTGEYCGGGGVGAGGDITLGTNGQVTVSNLNISSVNNFNQVINNNGGDQDYVLAGTGRSSGLTDYQVLSAQYPTEVTDPSMVNNYEAMANKDPATLTGWKKEFGVIDFVETQTEEEGEFHASNGVMAPYFAAVSDRRLKTDIQPISEALDKLRKLTGYRYKLAEVGGQDSAGVMAQEVREVLPEAVVGSDDSKLAVNYNALMPLLIESIKELHDKVATRQS